jgi:TubC N-terminal docking domain
MTPEILLYHLRELNISVALTNDACSLDLDAPAGMLTPELLEIIKSFKAELVEMIYLEEERAAIEEEGCEGDRRKSDEAVTLRRYVEQLPQFIALQKAFAPVGGLEIASIWRAADDEARAA